MKVVIEGATKIGLTLARIVSSETTQPDDVILFEKDEKLAKEAAEALDILVLNQSILNGNRGNISEINHLDAFIAATEDEYKNLVLCDYVEDKYNPRHKIAVVYDNEVARLPEYKHLKIFVPPRATARAIRRHISSTQNALEKLISGSESELLVYEIKPRHPMIGKRISTIGVPKDKYNPVMIERGEKIIYPSKDDVLRKGDIFQIVVNSQYVEKVMNKLEH